MRQGKKPGEKNGDKDYGKPGGPTESDPIQSEFFEQTENIQRFEADEQKETGQNEKN